MESAEVSDHARARYQDIGLILGPLLFAFMMLFDASQTTMEPAAWRVAAVGIWMATWWATEAVSVPVTAFLPIVTFPFLTISSMAETTSHYANPIIYLFLGAFILALAVEKWMLHKRIALAILTVTGTDGRRLIGGFMLVAALLSMWMTNTSTTMMLMPIALSVAKVIADNNTHLSPKQTKAFQVAMLLGLAYAATIGGLATLVGTPPNALLAAFLSDNYGIKITFASWMLVGVPVMLVMLPLAWLSLTRFTFKIDIPANPAVNAYLIKLRNELGPMSVAEKRVATVFALVVIFWILRRPISAWLGIDFLSDTGIVMAAALLLFLLPSGNPQQPQIMVWENVHRLPWGVLILFGGGLSLAAAVSGSGLATYLGSSLTPLGGLGIFVLVVAATGLVIFLTELTSNVATAATFLPVVAAVALELGVSPLLLCIPITLAASCAFMLPVATPPNAIVFASGVLTIPQMVKAGAILNIIGMISALDSLYLACTMGILVMIFKHPTAQKLAYLLCSVFLLLASTAFSVIASEQAPEEKQTLDKVLFVGNSFSFYNNGIHNHLGSLIRAEGNWQRGKNRLRLQTLSGGHIHEQLEGLQATLSNDRLGWQAVVLQAHSNEAVLKSKQARFTSSLKQAIDIVRGHRLEPILFMTWGYKDDPKMSQALAEAYIEQAEKHNVHLVPVGLAFAQSAKALPNVELFVPDVLGIEDTAAGNIITYREEWKHPSVAGTYLAACVFYASLYQKSPLGNPFTAGLDPDVASALQSLSWQIVSDFQSRS